jgi:hypothetical protein
MISPSRPLRPTRLRTGVVQASQGCSTAHRTKSPILHRHNSNRKCPRTVAHLPQRMALLLTSRFDQHRCAQVRHRRAGHWNCLSEPVRDCTWGCSNEILTATIRRLHAFSHCLEGSRCMTCRWNLLCVTVDYSNRICPGHRERSRFEVGVHHRTLLRRQKNDGSSKRHYTWSEHREWC